MRWSEKCCLTVRAALSLAAVTAGILSARAQETAATDKAQEAGSLKQVFEAAWHRQPEARAMPLRREAAQAQARAAGLPTAQAPSLELSLRSDRANGNPSAREAEIGIAVPLWLPRQRAASAELAQAEIAAVERRLVASQLRLAATVRTAWWSWQRARVEAEVAQMQLTSATKLATDVARRVRAGDLARADQHQADANMAAAEALNAQAQAAYAVALAQLSALTGGAVPSNSSSEGTGEPIPNAPSAIPHPLLAELENRMTVAERTARLVSTQRQSNPELTVATTRDRGAMGQPYAQSMLIGIRVPWGAGPRHEVRAATAAADAVEAQSQLAIEGDRIQAEQHAASLRMEAARAALDAAQRRARLASELRAFFDRSFQLGETDLPTRLRIEAEATEAQRQEARSRIDLAAALSEWRQSLGLLPE